MCHVDLDMVFFLDTVVKPKLGGCTVYFIPLYLDYFILQIK